MWDSDPLIFTILSEHRVAGNVTLADPVSRFISVSSKTQTQQLQQQHLHMPLHQLSVQALESLFSDLRNTGDALHEGKYDVSELQDLRCDLEFLLESGITRLSQWKEARWREPRWWEGRALISNTGWRVLCSAAATRPSESFASLRGMFMAPTVLCSQERIADPIISLILLAASMQRYVRVETDCSNHRVIEYNHPHEGHSYVLYSAIKSAVSDDDKKKVLEEAWEEAVVSSLPLTPRTCYSTVVMAVVGTHVRIGLLTLWEVGADLQHLPAAVKEGFDCVGAAYVCNDDSRACDDLKLLHVIEFCAAEVQTNCVDKALAQYFCFIAQNILNGMHKLSMCGMGPNQAGGGEHVPAELVFPGCPVGTVVKIFKDIAVRHLRGIHKKMGHPIYRCGVFNTQYSSEWHQYACCIYDKIEGYPFGEDVYTPFSLLCVAIIHMHDTLHVCHGDITRDSVIVNLDKKAITLINYTCAVDSVDTKPDANIPSVKALHAFLASMEPSHREYVEADHWLFHRLADVLAVFQRVWFSQGGSSFNAQEYLALVEVLRGVVAALADEGCSLDEPPRKAARWECTAHGSPTCCVSTKELMLTILTRWGQQEHRWQCMSKYVVELILKR